MNKLLVFLFLPFFFINKTNAQNFEYGNVSRDDINLKTTKLDSNANAMVIREFGTASIRMDDNNGSTYVDFEYHVKIKIFNKNGFQYGNIEIPQWIYDGKEDEISELTATTFNEVNGQINRMELDKKQIFIENKSKYLKLTKFTMPNLREGSVIEYSYRMHGVNIFNFKTWEFQSDIPKMYSEYIAYLPAIYNYNVALRGALKLSSNHAELAKECLRIQGTPIDCSKMTYVMKDVPAFIEEDYMTAPSNFRSAIYFELSDINYLTGGKKNVTKTWKDVDYELTSDKSFGGQMKRKDLFKDLMPEILKNTTDDLSKAKAVFAYIKKNITWNKYLGKYSENSIKKALDSHSGNVADINLALIAALSAANLDAEAVMLSTRDNGTVNTLFPVISDFNYVVAKVNIGSESYLLDASEPLLPFGLLPLRCINDQGRVINLKKPSYWYALKASQQESTRYILNASLTTDGKIKGDLTIYTYGYAAFNKRSRILGANSIDDYVEKLDETMPKTSITQHDILNLDSLDKPLIEKYQVELLAFDHMEDHQLFFNPFFMDRITRNPFNLNERTYPVDLGSTRDSRISISIALPDDYILADKPKDLAIALPDQNAKYINTTTLENNTLIFSQIFQLNKPIFEPGEYLALKEFYSRIIQLQKTDVVLKKSK